MNDKIVDGIIAVVVSVGSAIGGMLFGKKISDNKEKKRRKQLDKEEVEIAIKINKGK